MVKAICLNKNSQYYKEWLKAGYSEQEIYKAYVLNNYFLPNIKNSRNLNINNLIDTILPSGIFGVDTIDNLKNADSSALGAFFNNVLYFSKNADKATVIEESFHALIQGLVSQDERKTLLEAGKSFLENRAKLEGKNIEEYFTEAQKRFGLKGNEVKDYVYEEEIAKEFVNYYTTNETSDTQQSINLLSQKISFFGENSHNIASFLIKLFNKVKRLLSLSRDNKLLVLSTFDKIKNGDLKNRKVITNESLYTVPSYQIYRFKKSGNSKYVSPAVVQKLVANVAFTLNKYKQNFPELEVKELLDMAMNNWMDYYDGTGFDESEILESEKLSNQLISDVLSYLKKVYQWSDDFSEILEEFESEEGGFTGWDSSANEKDFKGYSKEMKALIINSGEEINITNADGENVSIYITPDPLVIYSGLVRAGSNSLTDSERLKKLVKFASLKSNNNSKIFIIDKLLGDFFDSTSSNYYDNNPILSKEALVNLVLDKTSVFDLKKFRSNNNNAITNLSTALNAFDLWSREMNVISINNNIFAKEDDYGLIQSFLSNQNNVVKLQLDNWINYYNHIRQTLVHTNEDEQVNFKKEFLVKLQAINTSSGYIDKSLKQVSNTLKLDLTDEFIDDLVTILDGGVVDGLETQDVGYLTKEKVIEYLSILKNIATTFSKKDGIELPDLYNESYTNIESDGFKPSDVLSFFKKLAKGNGKYNESILENSFQNLEKKTIYGFQWATNTQRFVQSLVDSTFIDKLKDGNPYVGQERNPDKKFFSENPITKFLEKHKDNKRLLSNIKHSTLDGIKETQLSVNKKGSKYRKSNNGEFEERVVAFGDLKFRDFTVSLLGLFVEDSTVNKTDTENTTFVKIFMGQNEASKLTDFVNVPVLNVLDEKGNLNENGKEHINHLINLEKDRIKQVSDLIIEHFGTDNQGNAISFDGEITREVFQEKVKYSIDIFEKYHTGYVSIVNGEINYNKSKLKAFEVTQNLQGYYGKKDFVEELINPLYEIDLDKRFRDIMNAQLLKLTNEKLLSFKNKKFIQKNSLIPRDYFLKPKEQSAKDVGFTYTNDITEDLKRNLTHVLMNMWLNTTYLNHLRIGDTILNYKNDFSDPLKRNRVDNAAGSSIATELANESYGLEAIQDLKFLIQKEPKGKSDIDGYGLSEKDVQKNGIDKADAQGTGSIKLHLKTDYGIGRMNMERFQLYKEMFEGVESDLEKIKELGHWHQVKKTVAANGSYKIKLSMRTLNKPQTSFSVPITEAEYLKHAKIGKLGITEQIIGSEVEVSHDFKGNYFMWIMSPNQDDLHERRLVLDGWRFKNNKWVYTGEEVDFLIHPTAIKSATKNVISSLKDLSDKDDYFVQKIDANAYKLQVENPVGKNHVYDPTQQIEISINELSGNIEYVDQNGDLKKLSPDEVINLYQDLLTLRDEQNFDLAEKELVKDGKPYYGYFLKKLQETLIESNSDIQTLEMFQEEEIEVDGKVIKTGKFKFNPNIPLVKEKFMQLYFKHFTTGVLAQKVDGDALAHISPDGYNQLKRIVKKEVSYKGKSHTIYTWEVIKKSDPDYINYVKEYNIKKNNANGLVFDIRNTLVGNGQKDELSNKLKEWFESGDTIFSDELRHLKPRIENGKIFNFVSEALIPRWYTEKTGVENNLRYLYGVRIPTQDKQSSVNIEWVDELPVALGNSVVVPKEIIQLSGSDFDIDKLFVHRYAGYWDGDVYKKYENNFTDFKHYIFTENKTIKGILSDFKKNINNNEYVINKKLEIKNQRDYINSLKEDNTEVFDTIYNNLDFLYELLPLATGKDKVAILDSIKSLKTNIENLTFSSGIVKAFENLETYQEELIKLKESLIRENETNTLIQFGLPTNEEDYKTKYPKGYTAHINNKLLDIKIALLSNDSALYSKENPERGIYDAPATVDQLKNLSEEYSFNLTEEQETLFVEKDVFIKDGVIYPYLNKQGKSIFDKVDSSKQTFSLTNFADYQNAVQVGKSGISYSVNANLLGIVAKRAGLRANIPVEFIDHNGNTMFLDTFQYITQDGAKRVFDIISTIITATTDEAKEGQLARHNMGENALKMVSLAVLHGMPLGDALLFIQNPAIKEFERLLANQTIKTQGEQELNENMFDRQEIYSFITEQEYDHPKNPVSKINLVQALGTNIDLSRDRDILNVYVHFLNSYDSLSKMLPLIKGKKGFGKDIDTLEKYIEQVDSMNVDEIEQDINSLYNYRESLLDNKKVKHLMFYSKIYKRQWKNTKNLFTNRSSLFIDLKQILSSNIFRSKRLFNENVNNKIDLFIIGQIIKQYSNTKYLSLDLLNKNKLTSSLLVGDNSLASRMLTTDEESKKLIFSKFKITLGNSEALNEKNLVSKIGLLDRGKISVEQQSLLTDVFNTLIVRPETEEIAKDLFRYFALKDGFRFRSNSVSKALPSYLFEELSDILNFATTELDKPEHLLKKETIYNSIIRVFFTNINNKRFLKKNRKGQKLIDMFPSGSKLDITKVGDFPVIIKSDTFNSYVFISSGILYKLVNNTGDSFTYSASLFFGNKDVEDMFDFGKFIAVEEFQRKYNNQSKQYDAPSNVEKVLDSYKELIKQGNLDSFVLDEFNYLNSFVESGETVEALEIPVNIISSEDKKEKPESINEIYNNLEQKTETGNVKIIKGINKTNYKSLLPEGSLYSMRLNSKTHFGNPFSSDSTLVVSQGLFKTYSTQESVEKYIDWLTNDNFIYNDSFGVMYNNIELERRDWIRNQLKSGVHKGKDIIYFKELGEPSHANALDYLTNKYDWNISNNKNVINNQNTQVQDNVSENNLDITTLLTNELTDTEKFEFKEHGTYYRFEKDTNGNLSKGEYKQGDNGEWKSLSEKNIEPKFKELSEKITVESYNVRGNTFNFERKGSEIISGTMITPSGETIIENLQESYNLVINMSKKSDIGIKTLRKTESKIHEGDINNDIIKETATIIYHMNSQQQEAFNNVKKIIDDYVAKPVYVTENDLKDFHNFNNSVLDRIKIPKKLYDNMYGITGGGGTGKTTMGEAIKNYYKKASRYNPSVKLAFFAAPTHQASTVLQESLGVDSEKPNVGDVYTYASLVGTRPGEDNNFKLENTYYYSRNKQVKPILGINTHFIIFDEASMMGQEYLNLLYERLKFQLNDSSTSVQIPLMLFLGDTQQLPPINKGSNGYALGPISLSIFSDSKKSTLLTEIKRSSNSFFVDIFNSLGKEIKTNINNHLHDKPQEDNDFTTYDNLTSESKNGLFIYNSNDEFIDDYVDELVKNTNPKNAFYVHYNRVENPVTISLAKKIREKFMEKIYGTNEHLKNIMSVNDFIDNFLNNQNLNSLNDFLNNDSISLSSILSAHKIQGIREYIYGDYVQFDGKQELKTTNVSIPLDNIFNKDGLLFNTVYDNTSGFRIDNKRNVATFEEGVFKPSSRYLVKDIVQNKLKNSDFIQNILSKLSKETDLFNNVSLSRVVGTNAYDKEFVMETTVLYNRQNRLRAYSNPLGLTVKKESHYDKDLRKSYITVTLVSNKDVIDDNVSKENALFNMKFEATNDNIESMNQFLSYLGTSLDGVSSKFTTFVNPFITSYIGSTHTVQGGAYDKIFVSEKNILGQTEAEKETIIASLYTALTRAISEIRLLTEKKVLGCTPSF